MSQENQEKEMPKSGDDLLIKSTNVKASDITRAHLNSPGSIQRTFTNDEELVKSAEAKFGLEADKEYLKDKDNGLDINDPESVKNFKSGYTPVGNSILVKVIKQEEKSPGGVLIPSGADSRTIKAVVITPGLYVNNLKTGDIVSIRPGMRQDGSITYKLPPHIELVIKNIKLIDISYEAIGGVFVEREELLARIAEENKKLGTNN